MERGREGEGMWRQRKGEFEERGWEGMGVLREREGAVCGEGRRECVEKKNDGVGVWRR